MQKQTRHAGETANEGRARCAAAIGEYWAERGAREARLNRAGDVCALLALSVYVAMIAAKLIGGAI